MSSPLFEDNERQQVFKFPIDIWNTIVNFYFDPLTNFSASRKVLLRVLPRVSKAFHQLMNKLTIASDKRGWGSTTVTSFLCLQGYTSLLRYALDHGIAVNGTNATSAIKRGHLDCIKLIEAEINWQPKEGDLIDAIQYGYTHVVEYFVAKGVRPTEAVMPLAVRTGKLELVKLLQGLITINSYDELGLHAAQSGSLAMVQLIEQYSPLKQADIFGAGQSGSVDILQYYLKKGCHFNDSQICKLAAQNSHTACIRFLAEHGAPMLAEAVDLAAKTNDVQLVRELRAKGCPWSSSAVKMAARMGSYEVLKFLVDSGCPLEEQANEPPSGFGFAFGLSFRAGTKEATVCAAFGGHIRCLEYLMERGAPCPEDIITQSITLSTKGTDTIAYLRTRGCKWDQTTTAAAAQNGKLELLKYLHANNCPWDVTTTKTAVLYKSSECLIYALDKGCPFSPTLMDDAQIFEGLATIQILFERGVPWTEQTCTTALRKGQLAVLKYVRENGAAWRADTVTSALESTTLTLDCFKYAVENGCSWDPETALDRSRVYRHTEISAWIENEVLRDSK